MTRVRHALVTLIVLVTFTLAVCTVKPQPVLADDTTTILIILGAVIGGLALFALIMTLIVRNNPAWMPLGPMPEKKRADRDWSDPPGIKFGFDCGVRSGGMPLLCW
jgi:hypothetical protein